MIRTSIPQLVVTTSCGLRRLVALICMCTLTSISFSQIAPDSLITTIAGEGPPGFCGDGEPAKMSCLLFDESRTYQALSITPGGDVIIVDTNNHRIRKISHDEIITTIAGDGGIGLFGDGGPAVQAALDEPTAVVTDSQGNLYFGDSGNGRIRKVDANGIITTFAGGGSVGLPRLGLDILGEGLSSDSLDLGVITQLDYFERSGAALDGSMWLTSLDGSAYITKEGLAFRGCCPRVRDSKGVGYYTDRSRHQVFKTGGVLAGTGIEGFSGDGGLASLAKLSNPGAVAVDSANNVYFADNGNFRIRVVTPDGIISTVVGSGQDATVVFDGSISSGDGGRASDARIGHVLGMVFDPQGNLYFAELAHYFNYSYRPGSDTGPLTVTTHRVRKVASVGLRIPDQGIVNAAVFTAGSVAPDSWVSVFGQNLAPELTNATTVPLPTSLRGTVVTVTDAAGAIRTAKLQFVAPRQLNFLVPAGTVPGEATVTVKNAFGQTAAVMIQVASVAPGIFSANASGGGPAAATYLRVHADGSRTEGLTFQAGAPIGSRTNAPVSLGNTGDQVYLAFYGTGFRAQSSATASVGGLAVPVLGASAQGQFDGLDQVNVGPLPAALAGRTNLEVTFRFNGVESNAVTVSVQPLSMGPPSLPPPPPPPPPPPAPR